MAEQRQWESTHTLEFGHFCPVELSGPDAGGMLLALFPPTHALSSFVTWHLTVSVISRGELSIRTIGLRVTLCAFVLIRLSAPPVFGAAFEGV